MNPIIGSIVALVVFMAALAGAVAPMRPVAVALSAPTARAPRMGLLARPATAGAAATAAAAAGLRSRHRLQAPRAAPVARLVVVAAVAARA